MSVAAFIVGSWVSSRIEQGVVQNSAVSAALYLESFISPLSQELASDDGLSEPAQAALQEIFFGTAFGDRIVSYKIWKEGGLVAEASDPSIRGQTFAPSEDLKAAWNGEVAASFENLGDPEDANEADLGVPLLEVYSPIRKVWTGEVVAVVEFYERANVLAEDLAAAKRQSWLIVLAIFATSGLCLYGVVHAGNRMIERQRAELRKQLDESRRMAAQNIALKERVMSAAQRSTAQSDRVMQRIGQDLHDGVAQHLSLASLRFEEAGPTHVENSSTVRQALETAMTELRAISRGLALPDLELLGLSACIKRAVEDHCKTFQVEVNLGKLPETDLAAAYSIKLCVYRFIQETLSNATRHADAAEITVNAEKVGDELNVTVSDDGQGFNVSEQSLVRDDGGQGLHGLRDRVATLNGRIEISSKPGLGTSIRLSLPLQGDVT